MCVCRDRQYTKYIPNIQCIYSNIHVYTDTLYVKVSEVNQITMGCCPCIVHSISEAIFSYLQIQLDLEGVEGLGRGRRFVEKFRQ